MVLSIGFKGIKGVIHPAQSVLGAKHTAGSMHATVVVLIVLVSYR